MCQYINGIYQNYDYYKSKVESIVGINYPFVDDIMSVCIIKAHELIKSGNTKIIYKDRIDHYYFVNMCVNRAKDEVKKNNANKRPKLVPIDENIMCIPDADTDCIDYELTKENITDFVKEKQKENRHAMAHALAFKYTLLDGVSVNELSKRINISRIRLTKSKNEVIKWLKEEEARIIVRG